MFEAEEWGRCMRRVERLVGLFDNVKEQSEFVNASAQQRDANM